MKLPNSFIQEKKKKSYFGIHVEIKKHALLKKTSFCLVADKLVTRS